MELIYEIKFSPLNYRKSIEPYESLIYRIVCLKIYFFRLDDLFCIIYKFKLQSVECYIFCFKIKKTILEELMDFGNCFEILFTSFFLHEIIENSDGTLNINNNNMELSSFHRRF